MDLKTIFSRSRASEPESASREAIRRLLSPSDATQPAAKKTTEDSEKDARRERAMNYVRQVRIYAR